MFELMEINYLLTIALSSINRNTRGFSLPSCGFGVTDPISINPNPIRCNPFIASACFSKYVENKEK